MTEAKNFLSQFTFASHDEDFQSNNTESDKFEGFSQLQTQKCVQHA
jgi:hypothetical protein